MRAGVRWPQTRATSRRWVRARSWRPSRWAFPSKRTRHRIVELYRGIAPPRRATGMTIAGGDLSRAPVLTIAIAAVGEVRPSNVKTRAGGRPGRRARRNRTARRGRAGLALGARGRFQTRRPRCDRRAGALSAGRQARCAEGRFLAASRNVQAMMDLLRRPVDRSCAAVRRERLRRAAYGGAGGGSRTRRSRWNGARIRNASRSPAARISNCSSPSAARFRASRAPLCERSSAARSYRIGVLRAGGGVALARDGRGGTDRPQRDGTTSRPRRHALSGWTRKHNPFR